MKNKDWMIYGAYGYNGALIAEKAKAAGENPILAGRDAPRVKQVAEKLGLPYRIFSLADDFTSELRDMFAVMHCAGPYSKTAEPMLKACVKTQTHYLDITGEVDVFYNIFNQYNAPAKDAGICLLPGVGFDVVPSDCLAVKLKETLGDIEELEVAIDAQLVPGASAVKSVIEGVKAGNRVREHGQIKKVAMGYKMKDIPFTKGTKTSINIPMGDIVTAYESTGAQNITVYMAVPSSFRFFKSTFGLTEALLKSRAAQGALKWLAGEFIDGETAQARAGKTAHFWAQARNKKGDTKMMELETTHPIEFTTDAALAYVKELLANSKGKAGAYTPAQFSGAGFVDTLPGVSIRNL